MRILLTNDDGLHAPGLAALSVAFAAAGHRVWACAPDRERSASSHSITLDRPLRAWERRVEGATAAWACDGTPADSARLGLYLTRAEGVDLVISGINRGMNLGGACLYSGTVGAALEAAMCGAQALAVSLCVPPFPVRNDDDYLPAARVALRVAEWQAAHPLPRGAILNLNVPRRPFEALRGIRPATLAPIFLEEAEYAEGVDAQGAWYDRRVGAGQPLDAPDYDWAAIDAGYATLTRLTWDFRLDADDADLGEIKLTEEGRP